MRSVLTIAGSDPTGGAGLQADLQVIRHFGCHGAAVVSALTVQDSIKVHQVLPVFPSVVLDQIRVLLRDTSPDAIKIGMLASDDVVRNVALGLASIGTELPRVIDPILFASSQVPLLERRAWPALIGLFEGAALVTPNLTEAEALSGKDCSTRRGCEASARVFLNEFGARAVLIKGGHRAVAADDLLAWVAEGEIQIRWLEGKRIEAAGSVHGTGCALSSAIAAGLACDESLEDAVEAARSFVRAGIERAVALGKGARFLGLPPTA